jgi:hypothetical protein
LSNPLALADLVTPALGGIIHALSDRRGQTETDRRAKAEAATSLILSFLPRDAIEMMLAGQTVLFNELLADGARDALREEVDTMKPRSRASVVNMGRLVQGHLDRLERRGNQPYQTETVAREVGEQPAAVTVPPLPVSLSVSPATGLASEPAEKATEEVDAGGGMPIGEPVVETSWLDEPYEQWRIESAADLVAEVARRSDTRVEAGDVEVRPGMRSDMTYPALPREPTEYRPMRALVDAVAG